MDGKATKVHVLFVEDDGSIRALAADYIRAKGFEVTEAKTGDEAISLLEHRRFDVVFSDVSLRGLVSGLEVAAYARSRYPGIPLLLTSGFRIESALLQPAAKFYRKPYSLIQILDALRSLTAPA